VSKLLEHLVDDDSEIVTVLVGCDAPATETQRIREHIEFAFPHVEVEFHHGGQPLYPYLVGVE
jgi:dihydroxyacetone kinase-like predicted kinase